MRKSSLKDFTSKKLLSHADVPAVIKAGGATCTDATIKGIRASIKEYARAGIISDEIATTYTVLLYTIVYYYILLYTIIYYCILLYTIIYYYILSYTIIYYYILLYTIIYY